MTDNLFDLLEQTFRSDGPRAAFELLAGQLIQQKKYTLLFELRLIEQRHALGLPLLHTGAIGDLPPQYQDAYQAALVRAARETGHLFLADGDLVRAWPYFRAVGEHAPIAAAIDHPQPGQAIEAVLEIALGEGVSPRRGFELLLEHRGICQAIDYAIRSADRSRRAEYLGLLLRRFSADLAANLKEVIAAEEGAVPETGDIGALCGGRDWLFETGRFYIENSHLASLVAASPELEDRESLRLALALAEYGQRLAPVYHVPGQPPFEHLYRDHALYLRAALGEEVETAIAHFRGKLEAGSPGAAEALLGLLARLGRYEDAIRISIDHLEGQARNGCPSAAHLCQSAGDYRRLKSLGRERGDLLAFTAGTLLSRDH
jgi:hypothetical protein